MISKIDKQVAGILPWKGTPSGCDYSQRPNWIDLGFDFNSSPLKTDTIIIVTSWWGHLHFMKSTLTNYRKTGKYVLLAYDFPMKSWEIPGECESKFPSPEILLLPHSFLMKHVTFDNDKRNGWLWLISYASGVVKNLENFKYVITVNSDCIWEKPEGVENLKEELGDNDLMSVSSQPVNIHTCAVIFKRKAFLNVVQLINDCLRVPVLGSWGPETLLTEAVKVFSLKEKVAENQPMELDGSSVDHYSRYNQPSTWKDLVGYRNLGAEFLTCLIERTEPIDRKYIDLDYMAKVCPGFSDSLFEYYKTGDRRHLYQAWDHNGDSWYDRVYYPIEHYGENPIFEINSNASHEITRTIVK